MERDARRDRPDTGTEAGIEANMGAFTGKRGHQAFSTAAFLAAALAGSVGAMAQDAAPGANPSPSPAASTAGSALRLELNRLDPSGEACRTYLLVDNTKGAALRSLKVDLFAFDTDGIAQKRLAVELGPIGERKTVVRLFDFSGITCPKIGRVLLNDVLACEGGEASRESCLERIETSTKAPAEFTR